MGDTLGLGISNNRGYHPLNYATPLTASTMLSSLDNYIYAVGAAISLTPIQSVSQVTPTTYSLWSSWSDGTIAGSSTPLPDHQHFPNTILMDGLRDRGIVPMFFSEPQISTTPGGDGSEWFDLAKITDGSCDTYLNAWFDAAAAWAAQPNATGMARNCKPKTSTILFRIFWEMNVTWGSPFPWQVSGDAPHDDSPNNAADLIAAFRYISNKRTARGATNVKMVWCPWGNPGSTSNYATFWPGASYVDYLAFDAYSGGTSQDRTMQALYTPAIAALRALSGANDLPIIIAETAHDCTNYSDAAVAAWISQGTDYVANHFPTVHSICYFDLDHWSFYDDPPNTPNTATLAAWAAAAQANSYRIP